MIPVPSQVRIWLAVGRTDMRRGMQGLALLVQETLGRDPRIRMPAIFMTAIETGPSRAALHTATCRAHHAR
ncbi:MAG: transposase [Mesorhizobium sp.]|nr:MAG: hypothetical protein EOQ28_19355 [Mesorhizobium sp.]RWB99294.1 MAG: hypothetical protein EOQ57_18885 [Mesorhizobium sp.]RWG81676.1 MAG: hypothetical protein EOQ69_17640 [Mesorhizobium sp.]RWG83311.1 MAG: hypothetical protein EOQ70_20975 [Mesorhizobium sp.]RWK08259.1 MAG: hypothetical protein EOR39_20420 [Mesorhizobium sp.]